MNSTLLEAQYHYCSFFILFLFNSKKSFVIIMNMLEILIWEIFCLMVSFLPFFKLGSLSFDASLVGFLEK